MHILILEDEELAARQVVAFASRVGLNEADLTVLRSVEKALVWLQSNPMPDLILSDIELLDGNVFALYERFQVTCPIIFTTAYDQFLLPAFRGNGIAYLLKPFTYEQFEEALAKYQLLRRNFAAPTPVLPAGLSPALVQELSAALRQGSQPQYRQRLSVRVRNSLYVVQTKDVAYLQADEGVVFAVDGAGARHPLTGTLTELEAQLDPARFGRLNRSELVNVAFVERVEPYFNNRLVVKLRASAVTLMTSAAQTPEFRRWLEG
ncbi:LytR/AlgR family response regulator transcription factor [Hymenobacter psychrophilus]|uniref:Two component transcriptional regulator, LytTR family n=1 Tax=Hymenobacter psychrophilus TaxID=651662 RepID=A0A1H3EFP1_9BACT|nr:LytTR family DNA-binding domain-containing protein [Hymenobacter psychrophilus]SDX77437.1 two component transcriptional regulator, LytTR family [Hymenobacter psychrophilus]